MSEVPLHHSSDVGEAGAALLERPGVSRFWGYNPVRKVTPGILHGVVSPDSGHSTRGCIPRPLPFTLEPGGSPVNHSGRFMVEG